MAWNSRRTCAAAGALTLAIPAAVDLARAQQDDATKGTVTIEELLKSGWDVAGFASNVDNRSTFILFKKAGETHLVQCLAGYDVTRTPRTFNYCYPLK